MHRLVSREVTHTSFQMEPLVVTRKLTNFVFWTEARCMSLRASPPPTKTHTHTIAARTHVFASLASFGFSPIFSCEFAHLAVNMYENVEIAVQKVTQKTGMASGLGNSPARWAPKRGNENCRAWPPMCGFASFGFSQRFSD